MEVQLISLGEKVCWLWAETHQKILEIAQKIGEKSVKVVRFEDLIADERKIEELFAFLDLDGYSPDAAWKVLAHRFNAQQAGTYPTPEQWEQTQHDRLWQICGKVAAELGYSAEPDYTTAGKRDTKTGTPGSWLDLLRRQYLTKPINNLSWKQAGTAENGLPFVQAENGLRFFGIPNNQEYDQAFNQIPPDKRANMDRDTFAITYDIVNRYAKQKQHLRYAYKPGDTVVELGAFLGYYAMHAAEQVGPEGKVIAVEALPSLHKVLDQNLQTNFPDRAVAVCQGVGARKGNAIFFTGGNQKNGMRKEVIEQCCEQTNEINVEIDTIDNILAAQNLNTVDLLIVQLNGVELETLAGIERSWDKIRNFSIAANYDEGGVSAPTEIANLLQSKGFATEIFNRWVYAKRLPASVPERKHKNKGPIFVGGCGRSGTTLLRVMLDSPRNVAAGPESELLIDPGALNASQLAFRFDLSERELLQMADRSAYLPDFMLRLMSAYAAKQGKERWGEKTPKNVQRIQYIFDNFPDAWFVHLIRDGRDTICSLRTHPRYVQKNGEWVESGIRHPIRQCIMRWVNDVSAGIAFRNHERYIELRYEDLVASPEKIMRELLTKIGEPWDAKALDFHEQKTSSCDYRKFPQNREATKPISRGSVGKWQQELSPAEIQQVKQIAGPLLIKTGYCRDLNW
jgi:FkbM family methyltransferase